MSVEVLRPSGSCLPCSFLKEQSQVRLLFEVLTNILGVCRRHATVRRSRVRFDSSRGYWLKDAGAGRPGGRLQPDSKQVRLLPASLSSRPCLPRWPGCSSGRGRAARRPSYKRFEAGSTPAGPTGFVGISPWPSGDGSSLTWRRSQVRVLPGILTAAPTSLDRCRTQLSASPGGSRSASRRPAALPAGRTCRRRSSEPSRLAAGRSCSRASCGAERRNGADRCGRQRSSIRKPPPPSRRGEGRRCPFSRNSC